MAVVGHTRFMLPVSASTMRALGGAEAPDRVNIVVLGEHLPQRCACAGDDVDHASGTSEVPAP
jgi:hypothetical protein